MAKLVPRVDVEVKSVSKMRHQKWEWQLGFDKHLGRKKARTKRKKKKRVLIKFYI